MKKEKETETNCSFRLSAIAGTWKSLNLHPSIIISKQTEIPSLHAPCFG